MKIKRLMILALLCIVASCSSSEDTLESQENTIVNFLTQSNLNFVDFRGVYRHIYHTKSGEETVAIGDSVAIYYSGYQFSQGRDKGLGSYYYGNIKSDAVENKFDTVIMDFTPMKIKVGAGNLSGLNIALPGVHRGDSMIIYMTSEYAYGQEGCYTVPKSTSIAMKIVIDSVWRR